ncbi:MAG: bifunctional metallophosphatase/5'-nucleotidase, partial [Culicoidibacterales bacterium]
GHIKQYQATNPNTAVLAAGDLFQGSPLSNLTKGEASAKALKELNIQYSALGNHEFDWDLPQNDVPRWEATGGFKFLAANIYDAKTGQRVSFAKPTAMITVAGKKVGLIGIATPETAYKTNLANIQGLDFRDPVNDINTLAVDLKAQGADAIVVLSHLGCMQDKAGVITGEAAEAAKKVKGVDAIITGHTHQTIQGKVNGVSIVQAASYGRAVAHTKIDFDAAGKVTNVTPTVDALIPQIATLPEHQQTKDIIAAERGKLASLLDVPVANNPSELSHGRFDGMSTLGQYFSYLAGQQLVDKGYLDKQPIVIMNGGGFRDPIAAGTITQGTMYNIMPFDNYLVTMDLTKEQVKKNIENGILNTDVGWVQFSGLTVYYDPTQPAGSRITEMYYTPTNEKGEQIGLAEELVDGKLYKVVTNDFMFTGGDKYDFKNAQNVKTYDGDLLRDSVQAQLKKLGTVTYNNVPRLLKVPDEANKLPEFNKNLQGFEYDLTTGTMFKVDSKGIKTAYTGDSGVGGREIIGKMINESAGDNSADISKDYIAILDLQGTFISVVRKGEASIASDLKSGETYTFTVYATDGKISPKQNSANGPVIVSKTYEVKVIGKAPAENKPTTDKKGTEELPDTSGKTNNGFGFLVVMTAALGAHTYMKRKYQ